jgi:predicted nucleic acid-binding protein
MNVYVESGFVLTLALQQDDHRAAEQVLQLAKQRRITLKIPAFSLSEPFATVHHRANNRNRLINELRSEIRELGRTQPHVSMAGELGQYAIQMAQVLQTQLDAMEAVVLELSRSCDLLQLDATVLARASSYKTAYNLRLQDAIILASVMLDCERAQTGDDALFISQNVNDFENPAIQDALGHLRCKYLADFANAVRYIQRPTDQAEQD